MRISGVVLVVRLEVVFAICDDLVPKLGVEHGSACFLLPGFFIFAVEGFCVFLWWFCVCPGGGFLGGGVLYLQIFGSVPFIPDDWVLRVRVGVGVNSLHVVRGVVPLGLTVHFHPIL